MGDKLDAGTCQVNSRHHQAVNTVAPTWEVSGTAPDGVVEAIEQPGDVFRMAVQWHPENFWRTGEFRPLFEAFVDAARKVRM
jgi:putative glutamine amidotransferase